jgi:hypothetical protein
MYVFVCVCFHWFFFESVRFVQANLEFTSNHVRSTKYTLWNFLPLTLLQQFRRTMNRYFLLIACLQLWDEIAPVSPITTWVCFRILFECLFLPCLTPNHRAAGASGADFHSERVQRGL